MDLSRVYRQRVFQSHSAVESHDCLRDALSDHSLRWSSGAVDSALYSAGSQRLKMFLLRYGPEVEVRPRPFDGFALVQMPLSGSTEIECDGRRVVVTAGQAAIVAPHRSIRLRWSRDCEQLMLRVPYALARDAASRAGWSSVSSANDDAMFAPATLLSGSAPPQWRGLMQSLVNLCPSDDPDEEPDTHPVWQDHVELSLALFLLTQRPGEASGKGHAADAPRPTTPEQALAAAEHYARTRLCAPLALEDLARAAGVSPRTLHMYCTRRFGVGPMTWLRNLRLDAARQKLEGDAGCRVTEVAMAFGFGHLGRFSAYYRARFGELPRETAATRR